MRVLILFSVLCSVVFAAEINEDGDHENMTEVEEAFTKFELDKRLYQLPKNKLIVHYDEAKKVHLGTLLKVKDTFEVPKVIYEADPETYYTLMLFDIDAPSHDKPYFGELLLWQVVNIPGSKIHRGDTLVEYAGSWPSRGSGLHTLVFLLYQQHNKQVFNEDYISNSYNPFYSRLGFSSSRFAMKYRLDRPIAGNFFQIEHDDSFKNELPRHHRHH